MVFSGFTAAPASGRDLHDLYTGAAPLYTLPSSAILPNRHILLSDFEFMKAVQWTVFIDMLGFKKLNSSVSTDKQAQDLIEFMTSNRDILTGHEEALAGVYRRSDGFNPYDWYDVKSAFISDSIVVTFKPKDVPGEKNPSKVLMHSANTLMLLVFRLGLMMHKCLLSKKITFRGGISTEYCDMSDSFAVGSGLSAANEAEGKAKYARLALADDVVRNAPLMKQIRQLFKWMYGDSEFLVEDNGITYVNVLDLLLAGGDPSSPSVRNAMVTHSGRSAVIETRKQCESYLTAQKALVIESIQEFWALYRMNYSDEALRRGNRGVLKKYFWLRRYHNTTVEKRRYSGFKI